MTRFVYGLMFVVIAALTWLLWLRPPAPEEAETEVVTEVSVRVGSVTRATLRAYVNAYGYVEPEPAGAKPAASANVAPALPGVIVEALSVEGQRVEKGDVLFQLDARAADVAVEFAEKGVERQRRLLQIEGTSERALQDAEQQLDAARIQQALFEVRAPLAGTVTSVNVRTGEAVDLSSVLATVVDLNRLVVTASVPSAELGVLSLDQSAAVHFDAATAPVPASVTFISPQVDAKSGTALVRVALPPGSNLRPGQFVTLSIVSAEHANSLAVPIESVTTNAGGQTVIAIVTGDRAVQRLVTTGLRDIGLVEVEAEGLQAGMTVVTEGAYALPEQTRVRVLGN